MCANLNMIQALS